MANLERPAPPHNEADRTIGTIRKNAQEDIVISLRTYKGSRFVDLRVKARRADGEPTPTVKGVTIKPDALPQVIELLQKAHAEAIAVGWCSGDGA